MKLRKTAILEEEEGEAILFDTESLVTLHLNESAILIYKCLSEGLEEKEMRDRLKTVYQNVCDEELFKDIRSCLEGFRQYGFLVELT